MSKFNNELEKNKNTNNKKTKLTMICSIKEYVYVLKTSPNYVIDYYKINPSHNPHV